MAAPQRFTLFCGIDVAKAAHVACLLDSNGQFLFSSQSFANTAEGFARLLDRLQQAQQAQQERQAAGNHGVLVGMEATGHYWYALHEYLTSHGFEVVVLNPVQTAEHGRRQVRKTHTDRIDARRIAHLLKAGDFRRSLVPDDLAMTCRQLSRLLYALVRQRARLRQLISCKLEWLWPEFEGHLADPLGSTGRAVLQAACTPQELLAIPESTLVERIEKASRGRLGADLARRLRDSAASSIGMRRGSHGAALAIRTLLAALAAARSVRRDLERQIVTLSQRLPRYLFTLPGINELRAVALWGEAASIRALASADRFVAFAGLDLAVFQSGQYQAPRRRISKRGSPHLRRTLWTMAHLAVRREGHLRTHYLHHRRHGLSHLPAVTAVALKLARIVWRILTDARDYRPEGRPTQP